MDDTRRTAPSLGHRCDDILDLIDAALAGGNLPPAAMVPVGDRRPLLHRRPVLRRRSATRTGGR